MKICVAGKNNIASNVLEFIHGNIIFDQLFVVCTVNDDGNHNWQKSLRRTAGILGVKEVFLEDVYEIDDLLFLSVEFDKIIKPRLFKSKNLINIHFSLLPKYKGVYTSAWPLLNGEKEAGVTLHKIDSGIDTGDIIDQMSYYIENMNARDIYMNNMILGFDIIKKNIVKLINNDFESFQQSKNGSSYYSLKSIDYSNVNIDYNNTASAIKNQIKAFSFFEYQLPVFLKYHVSDALILDEKSSGKSGRVLYDTERFVDITSIDYNIRLFKNYSIDMFSAVLRNDIQTLINVIDYIEDLDITNRNGWSALMIAVYNNFHDISKILVSKGANVNKANLNGTSVLMYAKDGAINTGDMSTVVLLLENGADVYATDLNGKNVLDYVEGQNKEVFEAIKANLKDGK
ncbi:formyltransferase family protein [Hymenobacter sp. 102]|uniref:formyltransferase family protein n=1 Tax=Hymenobacter sp. 102 TaxID=3403152 RepID=UPI003CF8E239